MVLILTDHPYSRLGTPAHMGPYSRLRGNLPKRVEQASAAWNLVNRDRLSYRQAADVLGLSLTTTWRRERWFEDWIALPKYYGLPIGPYPHQRGTRAVPRGRPIVLPMDAPRVYRDLRDQGVSAPVIAASWRTVPKCIRDLAVREIAELREALDDDGRERLDKLVRIAAGMDPPPWNRSSAASSPR